MTKQSDRFSAMFADLEAQLAAEERRERLAAVPELVRESLADLTLASRLAPATGAHIEVGVNGVHYAGLLARVGRDWIIVKCESPVLIALAAVQTLRIAGREHIGGDVLLKLGMGSPLREFQESGAAIRMHLRGSGVLDGRLTAVAADYVELRTAGHLQLVPMSALEIVQVL